MIEIMEDENGSLMCRCNQCMTEFSEEEQSDMFRQMERSCRWCCHFDDDEGHCAIGYEDDPDGCEEYDPTDTCPFCHRTGYIQWRDEE